MSTPAQLLIGLGLALIFAVVGIGFIRVDEATWLAWRGAWLLGGGITMGIGVGLILTGLFKDAH